MKPHPRIRKTIKWGGAAVLALLLGSLVSLCVVASMQGKGQAVIWDASVLRYAPLIAMVFWVLWWFGVLIISTGKSSQQLQRLATNRCRRCGYSLDGLNAEEKCPECGAVPAGV